MTVLEIAATSLFKKLLGDIYNVLSNSIKDDIAEISDLRRINDIYKKMSSVRNVKTLFQTDKAVDLHEFYCDSCININNQRKIIKSLKDLGNFDNLLIEGIAGQGKSIFLRYLCSKMIEEGEKLPIFIELRKLKKDESLVCHTIQSLSFLGFKVSEKTIGTLLDEGILIFLLDAFDELDSDLEEKIITEIEDICSKYSKASFIITSRPNSSIKNSPLFSIAKLEYLNGNEYIKVIKKLCSDEKTSSRIIDAIKNKGENVSSILCTPLIITLLIITYKAYQDIPENLSGFYDCLFDVMLKRHDGTKPGYIRERPCHLNDMQLRHVFETISYLSKQKDESSYDFNDIYGYTEKALRSLSLEADPQKTLTDIVKITCLLLCEGDEYRFIHKSVQEYYASSFVKNKPEIWTKSFYKNSFKNAYDWIQEFKFLIEIDRYKFNKFFISKMCIDMLGTNFNKINSSTFENSKEHLLESISDFIIGLTEEDNKWGMSMFSFSSNNKNISLYMSTFKELESTIINNLVQIDFEEISNAIKLGKIPSSRPSINVKGKKINYAKITIKDAYNNNLCIYQIDNFIAKLYNKTRTIIKCAYDYNKKEEKNKFFDI